MGTTDTVVEIETLETGLLSTENTTIDENDEDDDEMRALYTASFLNMEENFVKYRTTQWVLYSLVLILAFGIGVLMLLYLPIRRYILRKEFQSRKLYVSPTAIVYKATTPTPFPCLGASKKEKYVLLPTVTDIVIKQGYLQSLFGVYSIRIENAGVRRSSSDDLQIQGIANPSAFKKAVLSHLANIRSEAFSRQVSAADMPSWRTGQKQTAGMPLSYSLKCDAVTPDELMLLQKIEEVGTSIKRVQTLIEEQQSQTSESVS